MDTRGIRAPPVERHGYIWAFALIVRSASLECRVITVISFGRDLIIIGVGVMMKRLSRSTIFHRGKEEGMGNGGIELIIARRSIAFHRLSLQPGECRAESYLEFI